MIIYFVIVIQFICTGDLLSGEKPSLSDWFKNLLINNQFKKIVCLKPSRFPEFDTKLIILPEGEIKVIHSELS